MLAEPVEAIPDRPTLVECKWDGIRLLAHVREDGVYFYTRNGNRKRLPACETELARLPVGTCVDGEAVGLIVDERRRTSCDWGLAQSGVQRGDDSRLNFVVFDILALDGNDARTAPLSARRQILEALFAKLDFNKVSLTPQIPAADRAAIQRVHDSFVEAGFEGSILKDPMSRYASGERGRGWHKLKAEWDTDAVIMGYEEGKGSFTGMVGALVFGQYRDGTLTRMGTCSGFDMKLRTDISKDRDAYLGRVIVVKHNGVMPSGAYRHPQFQRFRDDKDAAECTC